MSPESTPIIRRATPKDVPGLVDLLTSLSPQSKRFFHPHPFDEATVTHLCTQPGKDMYFVQLLDSQIIGYAMLRFFDHPTPSYGCCIRKGYEGKGYGTMLTQWTLRTAKDLGYTRVILKVYAKNLRALHMYSKVGFTQYDKDSETGEIYMEWQP
jgi:RimJ/RimL family protein N-acetyltransferase